MEQHMSKILIDKSTVKLALEALNTAESDYGSRAWERGQEAITALREALAEPEFFTHNVEQPYDWSEWVCPDPKSYLMKCCDCGLVHEAEFGVVRYKSETEREDCDKVDDPNLQAVFRMRRSEQWSVADTAHRVGGLPMKQPVQQEPVAWMHTMDNTEGYKENKPYVLFTKSKQNPFGVAGRDYSKSYPVTKQPLYTAPPQRELESTTDMMMELADRLGELPDDIDPRAWLHLLVYAPQRKPLTDAEIWQMVNDCSFNRDLHADKFARAIEAAHGIGDKT